MNPTKPRPLPKCKMCPDRVRTHSAVVCGANCAQAYAAMLRERAKAMGEKVARKTLKDGRIASKSRSDWLKDAQVAFNRFIRLRDATEPCISCGTTSQTTQYAAGHYRTVGASPELRFSEDNVHKQCNKKCNMELSGNILNYRLGLIRKIGMKRLELLEGKHEPTKYTIDDCKEIIKVYKAACKQ